MAPTPIERVALSVLTSSGGAPPTAPQARSSAESWLSFQLKSLHTVHSNAGVSSWD